jgi:hypothetical protein
MTLPEAGSPRTAEVGCHLGALEPGCSATPLAGSVERADGTGYVDILGPTDHGVVVHIGPLLDDLALTLDRG